MRVLFVEDSKILQRSVGLRRSGYVVDVTGNGHEGLWYAEQHAYDVVILDLMLPGLDGLRILERLCRQGSTTQVLVLTTRDTVEDRVRGLRTGADDYLIKPFALEELLARVQALCPVTTATKPRSGASGIWKSITARAPRAKNLSTVVLR